MDLTGTSKDDHEVEQLQEANQRLQESLKACHHLVAEYRSRLAANGNDAMLPEEARQASDAATS